MADVEDVTETGGTITPGQRGARVTRTGIALVHEGELVLPADGSEAAAERVLDDARATIEYHFPVEIEVLVLPVPGLEEVVDAVLERIAAG